MIRNIYRKVAVITLAAAMICAPVCRGQETADTIQSAEEGTSGAGETTPQTTAPETTAPETPAPETTAPETPAPETTAPETTAPETTAPETTAIMENHSIPVPENPTEKKQNHKIVDAKETGQDGYSVSVNGGESIVIEPDNNFRTVIDAITGGSHGYRMDYIRPGTGLREPIDIDGENTINAIFAKLKAMPGAACDIVLYLNNGNTLWLNVRVQGTLDTEDAAIVFTSSPEEKACTVSYDANGGNLTDSISSVRRKGEWYSHFDVKASKDGVYFCGWYDGPGEDASRVFPTDVVEEDITLYAHYSPYSTEVVAFDFGFGTEGDSGSLVHHLIFPRKEDGTYDITAYPVIERNGQVIAGWKDGSGNPASLTSLAGSVTLTADWKDASEVSAAEAVPETEAAAETEAPADAG